MNYLYRWERYRHNTTTTTLTLTPFPGGHHFSLISTAFIIEHSPHSTTLLAVSRLERIVLGHKPPAPAVNKHSPAVQLIALHPIVPPHQIHKPGSHYHSHSPRSTADPEPRETQPNQNRTATPHGFPQTRTRPLPDQARPTGQQRQGTDTRDRLPLRPKEGTKRSQAPASIHCTLSAQHLSP